MPTPLPSAVRCAFVAATLAILSPTAMAQVVPQKEGDVMYVTGGIGRAETDALKAVQAEYNLQVTSSNTEGYFIGDTAFKILDSKGVPMVTTLAGPIFYAKLPAGSYMLEATRAGETKKQHVTIGKTTVHAYFTWEEHSKEDAQDTTDSRLPWSIPPLGTTTERITGTIVIKAPESPPAESEPAPVYQATPVR